MNRDELIENLADAEHASWARWMDYLFSRCRAGLGGTMHMSYDDVTHWRRQIETPYTALSEQEKESDRNEVRHILPFIDAYADAVARGRGGEDGS